MEWLKQIGMPRGVPHELSRLGLWMENVQRTDFETLSELACKPGKTVHHVKDRDGRAFVLIFFHLANEEWSSRLHRQLEALAKLDSAYIVRILGAFMQDSQHSCILMPHYARGDLAAWIGENSHADVPTRKRIAIGLLTGLHDIHSRNLVHCDIKPENVFLTPNLSPVLGDFDGVQMTNMTITQPLQATIRYMTPELRRADASKVSPAVDMFSAGVVLEELFRGREDTAEIDNLVQNLKSEDPHRRPSALDAVHDSAFKDVPVAVKSCPICLGSYPANGGISCRDGHYICNTCLSDTVHAAAEPNAHVRIERNGSMRCFSPGCDQDIPGHMITTAVPDALGVLIGILQQHFQRDSAAEQEEEIQRRVDVALREHGIDSTTQTHIRAIQNEVLAMSCPGCSTVFLDFDGCCALKCASCPTYFCAWCLEGTGNDSRSCHSHVADCAAKPYGEDRFYGRKHVVQQVWANFRAKRLRTYMSSRIQDEEIRSKIRELL